MRKLNFKLMRETVEWLHRRKGGSTLTLPRGTPKESYRLFKLYGAECDSEGGGVGDLEENGGTYSIPIHVHGKSLMGGEEFMAIHSSLGISKIPAAVVDGCYTTTPLPEYNGTVIIGPPLINFKKDTQYTLALHFRFFSSATKRRINMRFDYADGTFYAPVLNATSREFRMCFVSDPTKQLVAISSHAESATNIRYGIDGFGLFEGAFEDYDSVFEPYSGYRASLSADEPLRKIGFSADEIDLLSGDITRKTRALTIDGSSVINETAEEGVFAIPLSAPARFGSTVISPLGEINEEDGSGLSLSPYGTELILKQSAFSSSDDLSEYLSENPITAVYVLKDYTHEKTATLEPEATDTELTMELLTERAPSKIVAEYV